MPQAAPSLGQSASWAALACYIGLALDTQVTCLRPTDGLLGVAERLEAGAPIRGDGLVEIETEAGRTAQCCEGCGDACSRVVVPRFAVEAECAELCRLATNPHP